MTQRLAVLLATFGGVGRAPLAPGTLGTLAAIPLFPVMSGLHGVSPVLHVLALFGLVLAAVWAADVAGRLFDEPDSGLIVIDEVVGYLLATSFVELSWAAVAVTFALFRLFDILKPFPVSWIDRNVHGGLGVVADDLAAGALAGIGSAVMLRFVF